MITKGYNRNLGDPICFPKEEGISKPKAENGKGVTEDILGVGLTHSRVNVRRNPNKFSKGETLEGVNSHTQCCKATSMNHRVQEKTETKLQHIIKVTQDKPSYKFTTLVHLLNEEYLASCFAELKENKASGVDGISKDGYGKELKTNLQKLISRMKTMSYRPQPVRRVYIQKDTGKDRPIGIPSVEDKVVQMGIAKILEAIFDPSFIEDSYGFRKKKSGHDALKRVNEEILFKKVNYVIDADIEGFFDNIDHKWMVEFLRHRIMDRKLIRLIVRFLKSGIMEEGKYYEMDEGTPQGGILSPILANIYLHYVLDLWIEKKLKKEMKGYVSIIRYADDFIILAQNKSEGEEILNELQERMNKFGLNLSKEKTQMIEFGRFAEERRGKKPKTFDFLGFTHYCDKTREGRFKVGRKTSKRKYKQKMKNISVWIKRIKNKLKISEIWKTLNIKLKGHYLYYGISGNSRMIERFYHQIRRLVFKWMNRRSQRKSWSWEEFDKYLAKFPFIKPKIYVSFYAYKPIL
jgi:group II intron reverse transcriptase/maturase